MTKRIIFLIVILAVALLAIWYGAKRAEAPADLSTYTFISSAGESISVQFDNETDTAIMTGMGYENLPFARAISASGARYENPSNRLVLWNKGNEITLYADDAVIFIGSTSSPEDNGENPNESSASLLGTAWSWQYTELQDKERVEAPAGDQFVLTFEGEGRFGSTTDCNSMGGSYVLDGEVLSIGDMMMTKMYCEDSMEVTYAEHLGLVNSYVITGDVLRLNLNRDYGVMVFKRQ